MIEWVCMTKRDRGAALRVCFLHQNLANESVSEGNVYLHNLFGLSKETPHIQLFNAPILRSPQGIWLS
jgi:hypothetical protein